VYHRTIFIASDHGGFELKGKLVRFLDKQGYFVKDLGPFINDPDDDYPDYVAKLCRAVLKERSAGIMICKSGVGASVAANKFKGIYAILAWNEETAMRAKKDEDANVLCLGGLFVSGRRAGKMAKIWLEQPFEGGRHARRMNKIKKIERNFGVMR
jgi:ribose 5-phosphate isomerase B